MTLKRNSFLENSVFPVDIVLSPEWWYLNEKITFDRDFFYHPLKRVETEQRMEKILYERWGRFGLGKNKDQARPEIGAVHLAAGFLLSEMLGCQVIYSENHPPKVLPAHQELRNIDVEVAFHSQPFQQIVALTDSLKYKFGYLTGDINLGGILNIAMDLHGEDIFSDMMITRNSCCRLIRDSANPILTGVCCINMDNSVSDDRIDTIFETVQNLRKDACDLQ